MALALGYTRHELLQRLTSRELTEWAAYLKLQDTPAGQSAEEQKQILRAFSGQRS